MKAGGSLGAYELIAFTIQNNEAKIIARHMSSSDWFFEQDMGFTSHQNKHDIYDQTWGKDNWTLVWIKDPSKHPLVKKYFNAVDVKS